MKSALLDAFPRADGKAMRQTALMTFLLVLAAHAFCFLNLTFSGASVMFNVAAGAMRKSLPASISAVLLARPRCCQRADSRRSAQRRLCR